jgi:two-component system, chemotaxis family, response regulator Rcp1
MQIRRILRMSRVRFGSEAATTPLYRRICFTLESCLGNRASAWQLWATNGLSSHSISAFGWQRAGRLMRDGPRVSRSNERTSRPFHHSSAYIQNRPEWPAYAMHILLVEDSPGDVRLMQLVFHEAFPSLYLHVANDGLEALAFLKREGPNAEALRPDLIMPDLNMPNMDGRELLAAIKKDAGLRIIPVVVLTTSRAEEDILAGYALQASGYLRRPVDFRELKKRIEVSHRSTLAECQPAGSPGSLDAFSPLAPRCCAKPRAKRQTGISNGRAKANTEPKFTLLRKLKR